jgi:hypothetical protein
MAPGTYLLVASVVEEGDRQAVSDALRAARLPGQRKVHWHDEQATRRLDLLERIGLLPVRHVVVRTVDRHAGSERRRRICLTALLLRLAAMDVADVCFEARQRTQDKRDRQLLDALRRGRLVSSSLRMRHVPGPVEPVLWVPDIVAGAVGASLEVSVTWVEA